MTKFEVGKKYNGTGFYGENEMRVVKRTPKMIRFETVCGTFTSKIRNCHADREAVSHQGWMYISSPY